MCFFHRLICIFWKNTYINGDRFIRFKLIRNRYTFIEFGDSKTSNYMEMAMKGLEEDCVTTGISL